MEEKNKKSLPIFTLILLGACAVLLLGVKTFFHACAVSGENIMACHWAEQAVFALALVLCAQAALQLLFKNRLVNAGLSFAMIPTALVTTLIPGVLVRLCMMPDMRCQSIMKPAVRVLCIAIAALAAVHAFLQVGKANAKE